MADMLRQTERHPSPLTGNEDGWRFEVHGGREIRLSRDAAGWRTTYCIALDTTGLPRIVGLHFEPADDDSTGELTTEIIRTATTVGALREARERFAEMIERAPGIRRHGLLGHLVPLLDAPDAMSRRRNDDELRRTASIYLRHHNAGARAPVAETARELGYSPKTISNRLGRARDRGYLTSAGHGKAGGELTEPPSAPDGDAPSTPLAVTFPPLTPDEHAAFRAEIEQVNAEWDADPPLPRVNP